MFVLASAAGGGAEQQLLLLLQHLDRERFSPYLCLVAAEGPLISAVPSDVPLAALGKTKRTDVAKVGARLWSLVHAQRPDVILSKGSYANGLAVLAARGHNRRVPVIVGEESVPSRSLDAVNYARVRKALLRRAYDRATLITAPSRGVSNEVRQVIGVRETPVVVIPNMVDVHALRSASQSVPGHPFFDNPAPVIVAAGRLIASKGHADVIRALKIVAERNMCRLLVLGEGPEHAALVDLVRKCGLDSCVSFIGFVNDPAPYIAHATMLVSASHFESFGNVLVEAMALGTPIVSTAVPYGPLELIRDGRTGSLVRPESPRVLAEKITHLLEAPGLRKSLAKAAQVEADRFDVSRVVPQYEQMIRCTLTEGTS